MTGTEKRASVSLAMIYSLRMLGLFMILPVFALYAQHLEGTTPLLIGVAIGIYGLTQAFFQIPFGMASDRFGRKKVIAFGLLVFAAGSVVAATADSMWGVIAGRALQGAGAIAAAIMALAADLTREEHRTKAMAMIGASIGLSFAFSLVAGPVIDGWVGVNGIFWITAGLALGGIAVLAFIVPTPINSRFHRDAEPIPSQFRTVLGNPELLRLDVGIFILHMALTASFVVLPLVLRDNLGLASSEHWKIYLPVLLLALVVMVPFVIIAEKKRRMKQVFVSSILMLAAGEFVFLVGADSLAIVVLALLTFFIGFNVLEATLPSLISKTAPPDIKGTAMGVYSSSQFFGAFCGGGIGGWIHGQFGIQGVFLFILMALMLWFAVAATMKNPRYLASYMVNIGKVDDETARRLVGELTAVTGVAEAVVIAEEGIAYLKVDIHALDKQQLKRFSQV
ncbi:MAG: MFS transporter [Gammaproteobacteria bacterium]|nr:MFS transporter [Gammaproteobacteria bacterium]